MACQVCSNLSGITCGDPTVGNAQFRVKLTPEFISRVYVPCDRRDGFQVHDGTESELVTPEGIIFVVTIHDDNYQTYLYGPGWTGLLRQYAMSDGDFIRFNMNRCPGTIRIELLRANSHTPKFPINGIEYHYMDDATKRYIESAVVSQGTCIDVNEMSIISVILDAQGIGSTRPWVHVLTEYDMARLRITARVGTGALPKSGWIRLMRHYEQPSNIFFHELQTKYKIIKGDNRLTVSEGWDWFLANNNDLRPGTLVVISIHAHPEKTIFIRKIPRSNAPCVKCQLDSTNLVR